MENKKSYFEEEKLSKYDIKNERIMLGLRTKDGFNLKKCDLVTGDNIDQTVTWSGNENIGSVLAQPVHLRFVLKNADLFSFKFVKNAGGTEKY